MCCLNTISSLELARVCRALSTRKDPMNVVYFLCDSSSGKLPGLGQEESFALCTQNRRCSS